ncbi:MAG: hypothetical protein ABEJ04_01795 [Halobacteriaceae archaeon]
MASTAWPRRTLDARTVGIASLVGVLHAVVVLWIRSVLGVTSMPVFDPFTLWAFVGLTLTGAVVTYLFLAFRLFAPVLGVGVSLGVVVFGQWQYVTSLDGLAWTTATQPLYFYATLWPLPLAVGLGLAGVEWGGRRLRASRTA